MVLNGPASTRVRSTTVTPLSGPGAPWLADAVSFMA
jgi:hypothetical protein